MWEHSAGLSYIKWQLADEDGMAVFDTCLGCSEPGVQALVKGGTYKLTVGNQKNPATGTYRLQLYNLPAPHQFAIKIGDKIKPGIPGAGAGVIESPGAEDVYVFTAAPGQKVFFDYWHREPTISTGAWPEQWHGPVQQLLGLPAGANVDERRNPLNGGPAQPRHRNYDSKFDPIKRHGFGARMKLSWPATQPCGCSVVPLLERFAILSPELAPSFRI
jgi:hypothetical protein